MILALLKKKTITFDFVNTITCDKTSFSSKNIKNTSDLDIQKCLDATYSHFYNSKSRSPDGTSLAAMMSENGKPCVYVPTKSGNALQKGCMYFYSVSVPSGTFVLTGEFKDVEGQPEKKYFNKGTFEFTYNDWTGTIKFTDGKPTVSATSTKGEKASWTWGVTLPQEAPRNPQLIV
jgi:hypothetical protein